MSTAGTASGTDQAAGLRNIFGSEMSRVICIASTLDADSTIHLGHSTARNIKQQGHRVLLIDEIALADRKTMTGFLYPVRYDLGQVFSSSVDLDKAIKQIEENLWYATSVKLRPEISKRFAKYPQLDERLIKHELDIDYVIYPTVDPQANIVAYYGSNIKRILVTTTEQECLKRALVMIRQMAELQLDEPLAVLIVGGPDEETGTAAFQKLQEAAHKALEQSIEFLGWIKAVTAQRVELDLDDLSLNPVSNGTTHEFVLPHGFFKAISAKITA
jgi:MinD-like ATPase involved in chromosome partitioning or flagellar assembly